MEELHKKYCCENCENFDETEIPASCLKGHGKVAFMRPACTDFVLRPETPGNVN